MIMKGAGLEVVGGAELWGILAGEVLEEGELETQREGAKRAASKVSEPVNLQRWLLGFLHIWDR